MPLVFIHGVNTRATDPDYERGVAARQMMFEQLVARPMRTTYPDFRIAPDVYWGDLGVGFLWRLRSIPDIRQKEVQGPEEDRSKNLDLLRVGSAKSRLDSRVEHLGIPQPFAEAAKVDPAGLIRAIFAAEADRFAPPLLKPPVDDSNAGGRTTEEGKNHGLLWIAVDRFARRVETQRALIQAESDSEVVERIQSGIRDEFQAVFEEAKPAAAETSEGVEHLGKLSDGLGWALGHLKDAVDDASAFLKKTAASAGRDASLGLTKILRDPISRKGLRFLGDVLVYLHHGAKGSPNICQRVREGLLKLKPNEGEKEPLVVVTHSFGSEIVYDLLTSRALDDITIDLWVTVGAQTSLFAEMQLFTAMPTDIPKDTDQYVLGRPARVTKWVNFYDPADALSYKHKPVFGDVEDILVNDAGNLTNAHGHYFVTPFFYDKVAEQLQGMPPKL